MMIFHFRHSFFVHLRQRFVILLRHARCWSSDGHMQKPMSSKALADIQNLLAGTCPPPVDDVVTAANADSRSNAFAAAEGAPRPF